MHLSGEIAGSTVSAMATVVTAAAVNAAAAAAAAAAAERIRKPAEDDGAGGVDEGKSEGDGEGDAEGDDDDDSASADARAAAVDNEGGLELNEVVHALCLLVCVCDYLCASVNCVMHHHRATQGGDGNDAPDHVEVPPHNLL